MRKHTECTGPIEQQHIDGSWVQVEEHRTSIGGWVGTRTDITELKQRENALAQSEQRFRDFAETASDWLWEMDRDLRFTNFSEGMPAGTGFSAAAVKGKTRWEFVGADPEEDEKWRQHRDDLLAGREFRDFRYTAKSPQGENLHLRSSGRPNFDESGEFMGYRGTGVDETAEVEAAERARTAERQLLEAIESVDGGFIYFDADDRLMMFNEKYRSLFSGVADVIKIGVTYEELARAAADRGISADANGREDEWVEELMELHRSGASNMDIKMADGRWIRLMEYKTSDGGTIGFRSDVTQQKVREQELALKSVQLENTLEYMDQGISMVDGDLNVILFNQRFLDLLEFPPNQFKPGDKFEEFLRYNAQRGEYGEGDGDELVQRRI